MIKESSSQILKKPSKRNITIFITLMINLFIIAITILIISNKREKELLNMLNKTAYYSDELSGDRISKIDADTLRFDNEYIFDIYISIGDCSSCLLLTDTILEKLLKVTASKSVNMYFFSDNFNEAISFYKTYYRYKHEKSKINYFYVEKNEEKQYYTPKIVVYHNRIPFIGSYIFGDNSRLEKKFIEIIDEISRS